MKDGQFKFQVYLGMALLNHSIQTEWNDMSKPQWVHSQDWVPCECGVCFFCLSGLTNGITHKSKRKVVTTFIQHNNNQTKQKGCTNKQVNLKKQSPYCRMCYRKSKGAVSADGKKLSLK